MKKILLCISFFLCATVYAQERNKTTLSIDSFVNKANVLFISGVKKSFTKRASKKIKEAWRYYKNANVIVLKIAYSVDSVNYEESYYLKNNNLVFATEEEDSYFPISVPGDKMVWAGQYYFVKNKLIYHETLGHGKSESDTNDWDPEKETLSRLNKRMMEFKKHI